MPNYYIIVSSSTTSPEDFMTWKSAVKLIVTKRVNISAPSKSVRLEFEKNSVFLQKFRLTVEQSFKLANNSGLSTDQIWRRAWRAWWWRRWSWCRRLSSTWWRPCCTGLPDGGCDQRVWRLQLFPRFNSSARHSPHSEKSSTQEWWLVFAFQRWNILQQKSC